MVGEVSRPGVALRHGGVLRSPREKQRERPADGDAASDENNVGTADVDSVPPQGSTMPRGVHGSGAG